MSFEESGDGFVSVEFKKREYPLTPKGDQPAVCTKAMLVDSPYADSVGKKVLKLTWELDATYTDDEGEKRSYKAFSKPYSLSFGPKAGLAKLCKDLTGLDPTYSEKKVPGGVTVRDFKFTQFEGMRANLYIKHVDGSEGKKFANILDYNCDEAIQAENRKYLPEGALPNEAPEAPKKKAAKIAKADAPSSDGLANFLPEDVARVKGLIEQSKGRAEMEQLYSIAIDGTTLLSGPVEQAWHDKYNSLPEGS